MIKLTQVESKKPNAPALFLVPGGPGLSSGTLRSLDLLARSFELYYVDLPGTNGLAFDRERSLTRLSEDLADEIRKVGRQTFVLGHSFGGFLAAEAAMRSGSAAGVICIATPFTKECQDIAVENYVDNRGSELKAAEELWERKPSDSTFRDWLSSYGGLYFSKGRQSEGAEMLGRDSCSHLLFQSLRAEARRLGTLLSRLREWPGRKFFIAGSHDGLLPVEILKRDAEAGDFAFAPVADASHFVMFDQPETVARLIESFCATEKGTQ